MALALTQKQKAFVDEYLIDLNATRAYKAAYKACKSDKAAASSSSKLLRNPKIVEYLSKRQSELQQRTNVTQDRVIQELASIAFSDIVDFVKVEIVNGYPSVMIAPTKDIPARKRAAIAGIKQGANGVEVKLHNKLEALDKLGRHLGLFNDTDSDEGMEDDGFIDALDSKVSEVWSDGKKGDIPL